MKVGQLEGLGANGMERVRELGSNTAEGGLERRERRSKG